MKKIMLKLALVAITFTTLIVRAENKIDLSGLELVNAAQPFGDIVTGGQPTVGDLKLLKARGVINIINLRTPDEFDDYDEAGQAKALGFNYIELPIAGARGVTSENAVKLDKLLAGFSDELTFVHCASSNRVGALFALRAGLIQGKSIEESLKQGDAAGLGSLRGATLKQLKKGQSKTD